MSGKAKYSGDGMGSKEFRARYDYFTHTLYTNTDGLSPEIGRSPSADAMSDRVRCYMQLCRVCAEFRGRIAAAYGADVAKLADKVVGFGGDPKGTRAASDPLRDILCGIADAERDACINTVRAEVDELEREMNENC